MPSVKVVGPYAGNLAYSRHSAKTVQMTEVRNDWTKEEARALHDLPLTDLLFRAQEVHRATQPRDSVQLCSLGARDSDIVNMAALAPSEQS